MLAGRADADLVSGDLLPCADGVRGRVRSFAIHRDGASLQSMLDVGCLLAVYRSWTPACDSSEFGVLGACRVAHPAPLLASRSLLPLCNARSSSPHEVLSPTQAAA